MHQMDHKAAEGEEAAVAVHIGAVRIAADLAEDTRMDRELAAVVLVGHSIAAAEPGTRY